MKICFPFVAQVHQMFHSLPIALEIALRYPDVEVHLAGSTDEHLAMLRTLTQAYAPGAPVTIDHLKLPPWFPHAVTSMGEGMPPKILVVLFNLLYFRRFDALVTPERTTGRLRRWLPNTQFIWTRHGAGDRASGFEKDIGKFDFVLMAGAKIERRLLEQGLISEGRYETGVYAKFDLVRKLPRHALFENGRPTALYNPHFRPMHSSWASWGRDVMDYFAGSDRWNLVFAPHIRLFYPPTADKYSAFDAYSEAPNIRIDLGSRASADMTYTSSADLYIGDVSSQVAEFLMRPRPCVFLNAHHVAWKGDPNYRFWELGPVVDDIADLGSAIEEAVREHDSYRERQIAYIKETFGDIEPPTAPKGADAIVRYLRGSRASRS